MYLKVKTDKVGEVILDANLPKEKDAIPALLVVLTSTYQTIIDNFDMTQTNLDLRESEVMLELDSMDKIEAQIKEFTAEQKYILAFSITKIAETLEKEMKE